jgi:hypothetical protein
VEHRPAVVWARRRWQRGAARWRCDKNRRGAVARRVVRVLRIWLMGGGGGGGGGAGEGGDAAAAMERNYLRRQATAQAWKSVLLFLGVEERLESRRCPGRRLAPH